MFSFKHFVIKQDKTAMKVCTDACIFGASIELNNHKNALDIGTGTGLLSLMIAQRNQDLNITAVEIDSESSMQAYENVQNAKFKNKIDVLNADVKTYNISKFDLIICNPPFYSNSLQSPNASKNSAYHAVDLSFEELAKVVSNLLENDGKFWVLLPPYEMQMLRECLVKFGFFKYYSKEIRHDISKKIIREVASFSKNNTENVSSETFLITENGNYSNQFKELLKDYYTIF